MDLNIYRCLKDYNSIGNNYILPEARKKIKFIFKICAFFSGLRNFANSAAI